MPKPKKIRQGATLKDSNLFKFLTKHYSDLPKPGTKDTTKLCFKGHALYIFIQNNSTYTTTSRIISSSFGLSYSQAMNKLNGLVQCTLKKYRTQLNKKLEEIQTICSQVFYPVSSATSLSSDSSPTPVLEIGSSQSSKEPICSVVHIVTNKTKRVVPIKKEDSKLFKYLSEKYSDLFQPGSDDLPAKESYELEGHLHLNYSENQSTTTAAFYSPRSTLNNSTLTAQNLSESDELTPREETSELHVSLLSQSKSEETSEVHVSLLSQSKSEETSELKVSLLSQSKSEEVFKPRTETEIKTRFKSQRTLIENLKRTVVHKNIMIRMLRNKLKDLRSVCRGEQCLQRKCSYLEEKKRAQCLLKKTKERSFR